jgi:hypothetical protein
VGAPKGNQYAKGNSGGGRPSKYEPRFADRAARACLAGFTDIEVADLLGVSVRTINTWKIEHPEFAAALKAGKAEADERVERSLFAKATGYTFDSVKIFQDKGKPVIVPYREHVAPDTTAAIFWLKNRRPDLWRDVSRQEHTGKDGGPIESSSLTTAERKKRILELTAKLKP